MVNSYTIYSPDGIKLEQVFVTYEEENPMKKQENEQVKQQVKPSRRPIDISNDRPIDRPIGISNDMPNDFNNQYDYQHAIPINPVNPVNPVDPGLRRFKIYHRINAIITISIFLILMVMYIILIKTDTINQNESFILIGLWAGVSILGLIMYGVIQYGKIQYEYNRRR